MSATVKSIIERLDDARQRWWLFSLLSGIVLAVTLSVAMLVLVVLIDTFRPLPLVWLRLLLVGWGTAAAALLVSTLYRSIRHPRGLEATARRVELSFPDLGSHLINLVQFSSAARVAPNGLQQAAIAEAASSVGSVPFHQAASRHTRWARWRLGLQIPRDLVEAMAALVLVLGLLCLLAAVLPKWSSSLQRLLTPWRFVPQVGAIDILEVLPGDTTLPLGAPLSITARIAMPDGEKVTGFLLVTPEGDAQTSRPMVAGATGESFTATLPMVVAPLRYRLQIGDSQSSVYRVLVREKPAVNEIEVTYHYPAYLDMRDRTVGQQHADLEAPQYTTADLTLHCSAALTRGYVETPAGKVPGHVGEDRRTLKLSMDLAKPISYSIHLFDENGFTDPEPRANTVRVIEDSPPTARMVKPAGETSVAPNGEVPLVVRVKDDHGLGEVRLEWKFGQSEGGKSNQAVHALRRWSALAGATRSVLSHAWTIDPAHFRPGHSILVRAVAVDQRRLTWRGVPLKPQSAASSWRTIRLLDAERKASETFTRLETFHAGLWKILQSQIRARMAGADAGKKTELADALALVGEVRQRQIQVQTESTALAASNDSQPGTEHATIRQALNRLAYGEMLRAVRQSEAITAMVQREDVRQGLPPLGATQDRIIDSLRRLLEANRRVLSASLAEMVQRPGGDLPGEVQEKLRELAKKLGEFTRQQRRIIEATKNLAKKPMEDFTEEQQQQLKELAAAEDDWSRFMEETHSDFSKLPEQDFANPSLLEELVEVQTEIKMAADALTKKTVDIAVPLEQLGVEMAEELITNIEKWLPDTPDRERWSQEEPLTDQMKEAPMAELPGELEDLVGELMEEEEALFDEMEDVSSSWADSIDKGAGWDAMDGPISNMSAKGVTGNRLPNTSEIGGRSGEGRQGKASGEFVADTAVGKGGRKTPSRLAPDPQVKGQVKDTSKDPVGGATGGGKASGAGGEGLEGPVPHQVERDLKRLATKQADLRNRAETIDLKFQVLNYHHTDFSRLLERMAAVERDLLSGRYSSALRRRVVVLDGLQSIKNTLEGEAEVRKDQTINLPADIQQELLGGMQEASPKGWEELNREYFERLSRPELASEPE